MSIFIISDLHLSNTEGIDKPMHIFGDEWLDHDLRLKENWLAEIGEEDTILLLGDLSWGLTLSEAMADLDWIHQLPGHKVLFKGNHDLWWSSISKLNKLYDDVTFVQNDCYVVDDIAFCGSRGWTCPGTNHFQENRETDEKIYKRELLRMEMSFKAGVESGASELIGVMHYPPTAEDLKPSGFTEIFEKYGVKDVYYGHLHGQHKYGRSVHGSFRGINYHLVSCDFLSAKPLKVR